MPRPRPAPVSDNDPHRRFGTAIGLTVSILVHTGALGAISSITSLPKMDFELHLPSEVEFGLTDGMKMKRAALREAVPTESSAEAVPATKAPAPSEAVAEVEKKKKPEKKKKTPKKPRNEPPPDAGVKPQPAAADGGTAGDGGIEPELTGYAPPGAQIALRIDMVRIRDSALSRDVSDLLAAIPDWRLLLEGSGIDPLADLNRVFLASPNLRRSRLVVAGHYNGGEAIAEKAVDNLARERDKKVSWRSQDGIRYARWLNKDETRRIIALVGPDEFVITRPVDLPRVLAVARALAERRKEEGKEAVSDTEALLAMEEGEAWSLTVEGARQFARGRVKSVPTRLSVRVFDLAGDQIEVRATGNYDSVEEAEKARRYWNRRRKQFASHPLLGLLGMTAPLLDASVKQEEETVEARTTLTHRQMRVLLGFLKSSLAPPETLAPGSPPGVPEPTPDPETKTPASKPPASAPTPE
jgi:hypothetical protein